MKKRVAIVGMGLLGRAWSIAFARAGWTVDGWDPSMNSTDASLHVVGQLLDAMAKHNLLPTDSAPEIKERIQVADSLEQALDGTDWVQENAPEDLETKRDLWKILDRLTEPGTILASSTSGIVPSAFTSDLPGAHRCLVAHPLNPPSLIPAVELVPGPKTSAETMERAKAIIEEIGQAPIVMKRELDGFIMNRLQAAILDEAFYLVGAGYCSVEDIDIGLREGLALRWSFMGPFETIDLNAPGGVRDYVMRYGPMYHRLVESRRHPAVWDGAVLDEVEKQRRERLPERALPQRQLWRDQCLMTLRQQRSGLGRENENRLGVS
jgi:3-hydroxyacyl-CoA dehydrogenase